MVKPKSENTRIKSKEELFRMKHHRKKHSKKKQTFKAKIIRHLREWHRRLGIWAAFFLIFLSLTGIALNHTDLLSLAHQPIKNNWLLNHYGINDPHDIRFYQNNKLRVTDNYVWLEEQLLFESDDPVISMAKFQQYWLVLTSSQLTLVNQQGEMIDQLDSTSGLPANITALSISGNTLVVNSVSGYYQSDESLMTWTSVQMFKEPQWIKPELATEQNISFAALQFKSQFLTWERIILDAHSGRILGDIGVLLMDLVALILILLSISGLYIWIRYARSKR